LSAGWGVNETRGRRDNVPPIVVACLLQSLPNHVSIEHCIIVVM
jgi:hypothetical protein